MSWRLNAEILYPDGDSQGLGYLSRRIGESLSDKMKNNFTWSVFDMEYFHNIHDLHKAILKIQSKWQHLRLTVEGSLTHEF